uniref:Putative secreted protein n=1 Tax=Ixodes ricinus TaxID=34613 RepID=A0A6B0UGW3_IXORI
MSRISWTVFSTLTSSRLASSLVLYAVWLFAVAESARLEASLRTVEASASRSLTFCARGLTSREAGFPLKLISCSLRSCAVWLTSCSRWLAR